MGRMANVCSGTSCCPHSPASSNLMKAKTYFSCEYQDQAGQCTNHFDTVGKPGLALSRVLSDLHVLYSLSDYNNDLSSATQTTV